MATATVANKKKKKRKPMKMVWVRAALHGRSDGRQFWRTLIWNSDEIKLSENMYPSNILDNSSAIHWLHIGMSTVIRQLLSPPAGPS